MMVERFLVTGASSGLGLAIALEALDRGHVVIGTARDPIKASAAHARFEEAGGQWIQLDLTAADTQSRIRSVVEEQDISVLINNAGYGLYGALEDMSEDEIRAQMETNFFGTLKVIKGCIPHFRTRRGGTIVTMSSISGLTITMPSGIMYGASKFSLEAVSEGLALQLAPFNVRVLIVEPGLFRTNWLASSYETPAAGLSAAYEDTTMSTGLRQYPEMHGSQAGDPHKAAKAIIDVVTRTNAGVPEKVAGCLRLPLGNDAMDKARAFVTKLSEELDAIEHIARSTDFD